jgi:hypothetical protein
MGDTNRLLAKVIMIHTPIPTDIAEYLEYNSKDGSFVWIRSPSRNIKAGTPAGTMLPDGYIGIKFRQKRLKAHRIAYYLYYGIDPKEKTVDHKNHNRQDNRIINLRLATQKNQNDNTPCLGYSYIPSKNRFIAQGYIKGKLKKFGTHKCPLLARMAYIDGRLEDRGQFTCPIYEETIQIKGYPKGKSCDE